ncbi:sulfotransferase domain-containing protein [uncultured Roseovarius sp.]|uniref:sulfotransferase domain-containing protein n=1 Tax=uncultured Roseovarius sp. TaxID=293344 RepID=UPI00261B2FF7|nr:sulfotransferase domain-containing protein [uncultured Roseovarius sp.]
MKHKSKVLGTALQHALRSARKRTRRSLVRLRLKLTRADDETRMQAERMLRGRERYEMLREADAVIVSHPKCGRTWLRVMISRLYQQLYDLPEDVIIEFDNFHQMDPRIPRVFFTHDDFIRNYSGNLDTKADFYDKKVILLVRDPRDVAVSQFFHWRFRKKPWKKAMNRELPHGSEVSLFDFVQRECGELPRVIGFMNGWARERENVRDLIMARYEEMRSDPHAALAEIAGFLDIPADEARIAEAVAYASYEKMKQKEAEQGFKTSGTRLKPGDPDNPDSFKVRRAKVGGYRDYFTDEQIEVIDAFVDDTLDPILGYGTTASEGESDGEADGVIRTAPFTA